MKKNYENELKLVETLLSNYDKVQKAQHYIKEHFGLSTLFDSDLSLLYIWNEDKEDDDNLLLAEAYINEQFSKYLLDVDIYKPDLIKEEVEEVFVVYLEDGTTADICATEDDAKKKVDELNKEYAGNKATYKKEQKSNYIKQ